METKQNHSGEPNIVKSVKLVLVDGKYEELEVEFNDGRGKRMIPCDTPGLDPMTLFAASPAAHRSTGTIHEILAFLEKQDPTKSYDFMLFGPPPAETSNDGDGSGGASTPSKTIRRW